MNRRTILFCVFFLAGMPALIYQVVWQRVLTMYFGVDIYSTSITVATFMLGLGIGSLIGGRLADRFGPAVSLYAWAELSMGAFGLVSLSLFTLVGQRLAGTSFGWVILADLGLLMIPTTLMGITFPLMCRIVAASDAWIGRNISSLYAINTLGAALGALITAYLIVGWFGLTGATYCAASVNVALAALVFMQARKPSDEGSRAIEDVPPVSQQLAAPALSYTQLMLLSFSSGFLALGYEIVWYRLLGCLLHGTVYVFGTILCVFLMGIGLGSLLARKRIDSPGGGRRFALCQLGISVYTLLVSFLLGYASRLPGLRHLLGAAIFTSFHPSPDLAAGQIDLYSLGSVASVIIWTFFLLLIPTILMGYGFPNLLREGTRHVENLGGYVARIYFANIVGSTVGSLAFGFVGIHYLGTERCLMLLIGGGAVVAIVGLVRSRPASETLRAVRAPRWVLPACVACLLALLAFPRPMAIIRAVHYADFPSVEFSGKEDRTGIAALRRQSSLLTFPEEQKVLGQLRLYIDGATHGVLGDINEATDEELHFALSIHPSARRVLVIGLGDGRMVRTTIDNPEVKEVVIVELNGALREVLSQATVGQVIFASPKVRYVTDDGRRWLFAHPGERFDMVVMWPLHAAHTLSGNLFSKEFFEEVKRHLNHNGILYLHTVDNHSTARTLAMVFPEVLRIHINAYVSFVDKPQIDLSRSEWSREQTEKAIEADRKFIVANTDGDPLNLDLHPNSEYYLTYTHAGCISSRLAPCRRYSLQDKSQLANLFKHPASGSVSETDPQQARPISRAESKTSP